MRIFFTTAIMIICFISVGCRQSENSSFYINEILNRSSPLDIRAGLLDFFPPGTSKAHINQILVEEGGAIDIGRYDGRDLYNHPDEHNIQIYHYTKPLYLRFLTDGRHTISITFDSNDLVKTKTTRRDGQFQAPITVSGVTGF